jgi:hypothetical protein
MPLSSSKEHKIRKILEAVKIIRATKVILIVDISRVSKIYDRFA